MPRLTWIKQHLGRLIEVENTVAGALARYLRRRDVTCTAAEAGSFRCAAAGQDIAEAILAARVARASANASTELLAVEEMARAQRGHVEQVDSESPWQSESTRCRDGLEWRAFAGDAKAHDQISA